MTFNIGDTVQLKSGGPEMMVTWLNADAGLLRCTWSDDSNALQIAEFPEACVRLMGSINARTSTDDPSNEQPKNYTFNVTALSNEMRSQLTVTHYLALICFCDLLFRSSFTSLGKYMLGMVVGTVLVWCAEKLWKRYAT